MSNLPIVRFIDGEPPADDRTRKTGGAPASAFVAGQLLAKPGRWAVIDDGHRHGSQIAHKLRQYAETHDLPVEAVCRQGVAFARYMPEEVSDGR